MNFFLPDEVKTALSALNYSGYSAFIVGGAVRDLIMGKSPHDWDITTSALPENTKAVFKDNKMFDAGIKHGTVTVLINNKPIEITTYRTESGYSDHRRPDKVEFTADLRNDLSRRDFTCNAIAYNPDYGIVDYFGGIDDINNKVIRCVGDPDKRFNEDALRILRALRFSSVLSFEIEENTAKSISENYSLLEHISSERIYVEMSKLLCGANVKDVLIHFDDVIFGIFPELSDMKGCKQNHERHIFDVWGHTVEAINYIRNDSDLRFAMLFHDCGKPFVKFTDENGTDHFYSHGEKSAETADLILKKLKVSNKVHRHILDLVRYHDFLPDKISKKTYNRYIGKLGSQTVSELFEVREADIRAQNPKFLEEELLNNQKGYEIFSSLLKQDTVYSVKDLKINGNDLIEIGFKADSSLGITLKTLFDEVINENIINEKSALLNRAKEIKYEN